jgi:hypothetical protein
VPDSTELLERISTLEQSIDRLTATIVVLIDSMESEEESDVEHYLDAL